jgi:hypothetical protein
MTDAAGSVSLTLVKVGFGVISATAIGRALCKKCNHFLNEPIARTDEGVASLNCRNRML